jgi:hypothetical protein
MTTIWAIGQHGALTVKRGTGDFVIAVEITGLKSAWGHDLLEIEPLAGAGRCWVRATEVAPLPETP